MHPALSFVVACLTGLVICGHLLLSHCGCAAVIVCWHPFQADAASGRERAAMEARASKARSKLDGAMEKVAAIERAPPPKMEVGSLEEVRGSADSRRSLGRPTCSLSRGCLCRR